MADERGVVRMQRFRRVVSASLALGLIVALALPGPAFALTFSGGAIIGDTTYSYLQPIISGRTIVCVREHLTTHERDVVVYNRQTGARTYFTAGDGKDQDSPALSGDAVAWIDHSEADGEVWLGSVTGAHAPIQITNDARDDVEVALDGKLIVWMDGGLPGRQLRWLDREAYAAGITPYSGIVPGTNLPNGLCVDKGRICWFDVDKTPGKDGVYLYEPLTGSGATVREVSSSTYRIVPNSVDIHGDSVTWTQYPTAPPQNYDVYLKNLRSGISGKVTAAASREEYPDVFGDLLVWQDKIGRASCRERV